MTDLCIVPDCEREAWAAGLCRGHYEQRRDGKSFGPLRQWGHPKRTLMEAAFAFADAADADDAAYYRAWKRLYAGARRIAAKRAA